MSARTYIVRATLFNANGNSREAQLPFSDLGGALRYADFLRAMSVKAAVWSRGPKASAAEPLSAELNLVQAAIDWAEDTGSCHFCSFSEGRSGIDDKPHDVDCQLARVLAAREAS
jgi:hypothetical protein